MINNDLSPKNNGLPASGQGPWWKPGMQIMSEVSTWIIVPIVLALVFGKMLDNRFGTKPIIFLIFAGLGFIATCFGIYRVMKNYIKKLKEIESRTKSRTQGQEINNDND